MRTKQIVFTSPEVAQLLEVECLPPKENEVTVELQYSAISSGTEKANFLGTRPGITLKEGDEAPFPRTVGYSSAGVVRAVGERVEDLRVGDRVAVFWGAHKGLLTVPRGNLVKIPDGVPSREAAMAFIATFPLAAIRKCRVEIGECAVVMGLGILGVFAVELLHAAGAYPVIAVDPIRERRELALCLGADVALDPTDSDFVTQVMQASHGGADVCIEVTGLGIGLIQALDCMRKMGRIALLGCTRSSSFEIDYYGKVHAKGISLIGAHTVARPALESSPSLWTHEDDLNAVLRLLCGGRLNFRDLIAEIHSPREAQTVYDRLVKEKNFPVGVLFDWREKLE